MVDREQAWAAACRAATTGDERASARLLTEVAQVLRTVVRRRLSRFGLGPHDVEDIVQEVLLAIHLKRHTWSPDRPLLPWIHAIARHKVLDRVRRARRDQRVYVDLPVEDWAERVASAPASGLESAGLDLERALSVLSSPRQRDIVRALTVEGETVRAVASRFGATEGTVRVALHRGLARLRERLGGTATEPGV